MDYTEDQLKKTIMLGSLNYGIRKCINVLDIDDEAAFIKDFDNPESEIARRYKKGQDIAEFAIDAKIFELAKSGDKDAVKMYEDRKKERKRREKEEDAILRLRS